MASLKGHYFISDAHLSDLDWRNTEILLKFFEFLKGQAQTLFILGDLFELCFRYRQQIPESNRAILLALKKLKESGTDVYYLLGNHDYWVKDFVKNEPNFFPLLAESKEAGVLNLVSKTLILDGKKVYVAHGDEIDHSFLTVMSRIVLRSQSNPLVYFLLHPKFGLVYARWAEKKIRKLAGQLRVVAQFESFAQKKIEQGFDMVVLGHIHKPVFQKIGSGYYLNTGEWLDNYSYVVIEDSFPRLEKFNP